DDALLLLVPQHRNGDAAGVSRVGLRKSLRKNLTL
ncbi:hypothetical protein PSYPI_48987, partial [Pseudomonas syringae pv. pisi str. 1704B]